MHNSTTDLFFFLHFFDPLSYSYLFSPSSFMHSAACSLGLPIALLLLQSSHCSCPDTLPRIHSSSIPTKSCLFHPWNYSQMGLVTDTASGTVILYSLRESSLSICVKKLKFNITFNLPLQLIGFFIEKIDMIFQKFSSQDIFKIVRTNKKVCNSKNLTEKIHFKCPILKV